METQFPPHLAAFGAKLEDLLPIGTVRPCEPRDVATGVSHEGKVVAEISSALICQSTDLSEAEQEAVAARWAGMFLNSARLQVLAIERRMKRAGIPVPDFPADLKLDLDDTPGLGRLLGMQQ